MVVDKKKILLYEHGGSYNHGCEAIVRTTIKMLDINKDNGILLSHDMNSDKQFGLDKCISIIQLSNRVLKRDSINGVVGRLRCRLTKESYDDYEFEYNHKSYTRFDSRVALSIGGDNYCYGSCYQLIDHNRALRKRGIKTVLWGCSLNDISKNPQLADDLSRFDLITARESVTYDILYKNKINTRILKCADPAFTLEPKQVKLPWKRGTNIIGINLSPLVMALEKNNLLFNSYCVLLDYIINYQGLSVALVSHVNNSKQEWTNDIGVARKLYERFPDNTFLISDRLNCQELKYIISKCIIFVGARTHATIAAYSSCVPTLVVGYSTKAKGIANDIFSNEDDRYILDINGLNTKYDLLEQYKRLFERCSSIENYLKDFIPEYKKSATLGADALKSLI